VIKFLFSKVDYHKKLLLPMETLFFQNLPDTRPFVVFGLLPHEEKMSVLNMTISLPKFAPGTTEMDSVPTFRNKDEVIIQCGFRRFRQRILLSEHTNGHLHKMEKYLYPDSSLVATCFGQIMYPPAPVLFFLPPDSMPQDQIQMQEDSTIAPYFLGAGSLFSVDPNRIVVKRTILTGTPTRIHPSQHRHTAIIRYMFFNNEDVDYFKPIELRTKLGHRGHILGSVGTHGAMKCGFSKALNSMDTVCLNLYKRVYPKWRSYHQIFENLGAQ
jgi:pre-rRNA-processing protein TSR1